MKEDFITIFSIVLIGIISMLLIIITNNTYTQPEESNVTVIVVEIPVEKEIIVQQPKEEKIVAKVETKDKSEKVEPKVTEKKEEPKIDNKTYLLAQLISAEAKGEPYNGKIAVGNVVLNRVNHDQFPDTIKEVIFQKGQFSPVSNGAIYNEPDSESLQAAKEVMNGKKVVGDKALYFYNPDTSTSSWIFTRTTLKDIGNHRFAY